MLKVADICPLAFNPIKDKFARDHCYIQKFYTTDKILIQLIRDGGVVMFPTAQLNNLSTGTSTSISFSHSSINSYTNLFYVNISGLSDGIYSISISGISINDVFYSSVESEPFEVSSNSNLLNETVLLRCSHYDNNSTVDNIWWIGNTQQFISFRIEAGFKPSGITQNVDNEFFRDQNQSITQLYAVPYETLSLSIGNASGVPYWVGRLINRMLCVSYFEVEGVKYVRSENSIPEATLVNETGQLFWYTQSLELSNNDIAGIGGTPQAADPSNVLATSLNGLKDGEILRYSGDKSAFINTDTID